MARKLNLILLGAPEVFGQKVRKNCFRSGKSSKAGGKTGKETLTDGKGRSE